MDSDRQIRLLIPPFFFFASLLFGVWLTDNQYRQFVWTAEGEKLAAAGAVVAASLLPVGFVISSLTFVLLRIVFWPTGRSFETHLSAAALKEVWPRLRTTLTLKQEHSFYAAITLDHELLAPGLHAWIMRRWNAFLICVQGCTALLLAHVVGYRLGLGHPRPWCMASATLFILLAVNAVAAWRGTMEMIEFQAHRMLADK